jgi:hypothetical protein
MSAVIKSVILNVAVRMLLQYHVCLYKNQSCKNFVVDSQKEKDLEHVQFIWFHISG